MIRANFSASYIGSGLPDINMRPCTKHCLCLTFRPLSENQLFDLQDARGPGDFERADVAGDMPEFQLDVIRHGMQLHAQ